MFEKKVTKNNFLAALQARHIAKAKKVKPKVKKSPEEIRKDKKMKKLEKKSKGKSKF